MIAAGAPVARPTAVPPPRLCIGHSPRALENSDPLGAGVIPPPASLAFAEVNAATTLQGTIGDIAVDDVLRLLESRRQTGVLLVNPSNPLRLVLADGAIVLGVSSSTMAIGRFLLACGMVTAEQLEELLGLVRSRLGERQTRSLDEIQVIEMLVDTVPAADLRVAVRSQAVAVMFETMVLPDAPWTFTEAAPHPLAERFVFGVGELLESADEQIRAWPELRQRVGDDATHLRRVPRLGAHQTPVILDAVDWAALSEIDERSTVGQIGHRLGLGRPDAYAVLAGLLDRGVVEPG